MSSVPLAGAGPGVGVALSCKGGSTGGAESAVGAPLS